MSQAVVFLARGVDGGLDAARAFLDSYRAHPAGRPHELIVLAKGWETVPGRGDLETMVRAEGGRTVDLPDDGYDWGAYMRIAPQLDHEWVCFLNTHSRILADGWLDKLRTAAEMPGVGAAGATGCWLSHVQSLKFIPGQVADYRHRKGLLRSGLLALYLPIVGIPLAYAAKLRNFPRFPNPFLRTNAICLRRGLLLEFLDGRGIPQSKNETFMIECGRKSLTRFVVQRGLTPVVVGSDGSIHEPAKWISSHTFRVPGQANLLVSDNQTRDYDAAVAWYKRLCERTAWGRTWTGLAK